MNNFLRLIFHLKTRGRDVFFKTSKLTLLLGLNANPKCSPTANTKT